MTTVNPQSFIDPYAGVAGGNPFPRPRVQPDEFDTYQYARPVSGGVLDPNAATGYSQNWNLTVEQQLWSKVAVSARLCRQPRGEDPRADAAQSRGLHAGGDRRDDQRAPAVSPGLSDVEIATPYQTSNYHSLQLNATSRASKGLTLLANYVWSKTIDNGSATVEGNTNWTRNSNDPGLDRGPADFDVRHRVNVSASTTFRRWKGDGPVCRAAARLAVQRHPDREHRPAVHGQERHRPIADRDRPGQRRHRRRSRRGRPAPTSRSGSTRRPSCRRRSARSAMSGATASVAPAMRRSTWRCSATSRSSGRFRLQLRAEAFNALNHTNFLNPERDRHRRGELRPHPVGVRPTGHPVRAEAAVLRAGADGGRGENQDSHGGTEARRPHGEYREGRDAGCKPAFG